MQSSLLNYHRTLFQVSTETHMTQMFFMQTYTCFLTDSEILRPINSLRLRIFLIKINTRITAKIEHVDSRSVGASSRHRFELRTRSVHLCWTARYPVRGAARWSVIMFPCPTLVFMCTTSNQQIFNWDARGKNARRGKKKSLLPAEHLTFLSWRATST